MLDVSIIIPVFNDIKAIKQTLMSLRKQTIPSTLFEIIVVDNGSTDGSVEWLQQQEDIIFIQENNYKGSPYSCRNRGLELAKGQYIALLDSTCIPADSWVENGINFFSTPEYEFFGGKVKFNFEGNPTIGKMYDSISNVQMEYSIKEKQEAKTANLWVRKSLFERMGFFSEGVRSGEDVRWTKHCTKAGVILGYSDNCTVYKYARGTRELLIKQLRVGRGQVRLWRSQNTLKQKLMASFKKTIFPVRLNTLKEQINRNKDISYSTPLVIKLYFMAYMSAIATFCGNIQNLSQKNK
jgi:GT2 family glycosyltransferase